MAKEASKKHLSLFVGITSRDIKNFRMSARLNYVPDSPIKDTWHPIYQEECHKINAELFSAKPGA